MSDQFHRKCSNLYRSFDVIVTSMRRLKRVDLTEETLPADFIHFTRDANDRVDVEEKPYVIDHIELLAEDSVAIAVSDMKKNFYAAPTEKIERVPGTEQRFVLQRGVLFEQMTCIHPLSLVLLSHYLNHQVEILDGVRTEQFTTGNMWEYAEDFKELAQFLKRFKDDLIKRHMKIC